MLCRETPFLRVPGVRVLATCWCGSSTYELVAAPRDLLQHFLCSTPAHPLLPWPIFSLSYNTYPYLECKVDISFLQQTIKLFPETTPFYPKSMNFNTICKLCEYIQCITTMGEDVSSFFLHHADVPEGCILFLVAAVFRYETVIIKWGVSCVLIECVEMLVKLTVATYIWGINELSHAQSTKKMS